jgi:hypothetical protein
MKPLFFFASTITAHYIYRNRRMFSGLYTDLCVFFGRKPVDIKPEQTPIEQYVNIHTDRFLKTYETPDHDFNTNIEDCFYDKGLLKHELVESKNILEMAWKRRLLYESTPRGNIIMHYDPYKLGFVYYSDTNTISSPILNAAAMKYCISYRCRDFFVDNEVTPEKTPSSLIALHYIEKREPNKLKKGGIIDNSAFAKFKNYSKKTNKVISKNDGEKPMESKLNPEDICKNRFIYMGKTCNISVIQPVSKNDNKLNGFQSSHMDNLAGETNLQKNVLSYKEFKLADT